MQQMHYAVVLIGNMCLDWTDPGFDASVLTEFRARLVKSDKGLVLFDLLLEKLRLAKLVKARGQQRTDAANVLAAIVSGNRFECVGETMRHVLNILATVGPDWIAEQTQREWFDRYSSQAVTSIAGRKHCFGQNNR
ncbi:MAG: hypothetical protein JNN15_21335 [Blastocatellia bacterium]|nr:hypothetical protein [Blastocatellia bacterium]